MFEDFKSFASLVGSFGLGAAFIICIAIYFLFHPADLYKLFSFIVGSINRITGFFNKTAIKAQVEAHINDAIQILSKEVPSAFIETIKLEWIKSGQDCSNLKDGSVIVCISQDNNLAKPIVDSTMLYLKNGLLNEARPFIERRILSAIELVLAYRILRNSPQKDAINYLTDFYADPILNDQAISDFYNKADNTNQAGILTRIILREYSGLPIKLKGKIPNSAIRKETVKFFDFASRFVDRDNEIPLQFFGNYFRCTIALIAKMEKVEKSGLRVYQSNFRRDIEKGVDIIYLLSRGERNTKVGRHIARWANDEELIIGSIPDNFTLADGNGVLFPAECIVCISSKIGRDMKLSPVEEAQIALSRIIPETLTGEIDIISVAREPGKITKVLIHSDSHPNPIIFCKGENNEKLNLLIQELGESELIDFIKYQPNIKDNVVSALTPLDSNDVEFVQLSRDETNVRVVVKNKFAAQRAGGTDSINLFLACKLLDINIDLEIQESGITPEQVVVDILNYLVPEIKSGEIKIYKIARVERRKTKIAIYSDSIKNLHDIFFSSDNIVTDDISLDLNGENVNIIMWDRDDMEKNIIESLYPLRRSEVVNIDFDKENNQAFVYVNDSEIIRLIIGRDGINVKLAEIICDLKLDIRLKK